MRIALIGAGSKDVIFTSARFRGTPGDSKAILAEMNAITEARSSTQPVNTRLRLDSATRVRTHLRTLSRARGNPAKLTPDRRHALSVSGAGFIAKDLSALHHEQWP